MKLTVYIDPVAKARPRTVTGKDEKVHSFTPRQTEKAEWAIRKAFLALELPSELLEGPLRADLTFYRLRPKSTPKKARLPITKPEIDNLCKTVLDALEKYLYRCDAQITTALLKKRYGSPPRIEIDIYDDEEEPCPATPSANGQQSALL